MGVGKKSFKKDSGKRRKCGSFAHVYIQASFNNSIVSVADTSGNVIAWMSAGACGFKGAKKGTPFAASVVSSQVSKKVMGYGVRDVAVIMKGAGPCRESLIRSLKTSGLSVVSIEDRTFLPHNGCRPPKPRRV